MSKLLSVCSLLLILALFSPRVMGNEDVTISKTGETASIGNEYLVREFSTAGKRVRTACIVNKRTDGTPLKIVPAAPSEEFIIRTLDADSVSGTILASALTLKDVQESAGKDGCRKLTFSYEPYRHQGADWTINMVFTMQPGKHYMRKYLQVGVDEAHRSQARIDYIDMESLKVPQDYAAWTHPEMAEGVGGVNGYYISLGQPVYIQGMFFGSEFPVAETEITKENVAHIRYYSGKSFDMLQKENRLADGLFTTWNEVTGAARSTDMDVIQSDFFSYINDIAVPTRLRIQYNSWYDFMMDIDESNILGSFKEIERGLTQNGVRPLDSYVVDDGWNAYGPYLKENTTKFWMFNSKFPNGLSTPTDLAHRFASDFGLWLGPRGGYNYMDSFAKFLEENGNGKFNKRSWDICTNHKAYLVKLKEFFLDCQKKYDINYWKLDGFMVTPPEPDPLGNYVSGGHRGMYYVTEHWERWIDIFQAMRDFRKRTQDDMWINLTCYMNPSPWFLQWANSTWIQNSGDMGRLDVGRPAQVDQLLTYRDDRYFDFVKTRAFQFPLANLYNHDPIYGNTAELADQMNDDEFRTYLFMMATRGTAFWELYYSYNMMNEGQKWAINADVLRWIGANYPILQHAKLIGETPAKKTPYGFSAWKDGEGIISLRNPANQPQTFTVVMDRNIGLREGLKNLHRTPVWMFNGKETPATGRLFNYGDQLTVDLQPGEVQIWKFSTEADRTAPRVKTLKAVSPLRLTVEFDEPVQVKAADFSLAGNNVTEAVMLADRHTAALTLAAPLKENKTSKLQIAGVTDYSGNRAKATAPFTCYKDRQIPLSMGVSGTGDFNVSFRLKTSAGNTPLLSQGKEWGVLLDSKGHLLFTVEGVQVVSSCPVTTGAETGVSLCREKNGMLKIYLDGVLDNSGYDPAIINFPIKATPVTVAKSARDAVSSVTVTDYALSFKENKL